MMRCPRFRYVAPESLAEAAAVLKNLGPKEVQKIGHAMAALKAVPRERVEEVLNEFQDHTAKGAAVSVDEGMIKAMLTKALGDDRAANLISRIMQGGDTTSPVLISNWPLWKLHSITSPSM